jgi:LuxR family transcriptional regulator, maltose regulon positive regulatory protein
LTGGLFGLGGTGDMTTMASKRTAHERARREGSGGRLLESKLRVPHPVFRVLRRARLTSLLDLTTQHRVTLVCAPAGCGKTTACASWAASRADAMRIAWLSLDHADNDPARFRSYLLAALRRPALDVEKGLEEELRAADRSSPDEFPLPLIKAAERLTQPLTIVLDDVHTLTDAVVLSWLDQLVRYAPPMLHLLLSGRRTPPLQLARLRVSGDLADVGAQDLACTPDEAQAYFAMLGMRLDQATLADLLVHTQGWMAGIRLAALRGPLPPGVGVPGIAGDDPIVTDYLRDEVLADSDPQTRVFLLRTSIAENLTGELADALTGTADGARCLDHLSRENGFVDIFDSGRTWYRYHPLLRELLLAELRREMPHEIPVLLRRAARWYAGQGRPVDALRACVEAQDWGFAAEVLAASDVSILMSRGPGELERMLVLVPPELAVDDVAVASAWAAARLWSNDPDGAQAHLEAAERALDRAPAPMRRIMEPKLMAYRVIQASCRMAADPGLLARARSEAERTSHPAGAQAAHRALGLLWWALGVAYMRKFEVRQAGAALANAGRELGAGNLGELQDRARAWQTLAQAWNGNLTEAEADAVEVVNVDPPAPLATRHIAHLALAYVNMMRDETAVVHRLLDQIDYQQHTGMPGEPSIVSAAAVIRSRTLIAQGDTVRARASLAHLTGTASRANPFVTRMAATLEGEMAVRAGDRDLGRKVAVRMTSDEVDMSRRADLITLAWVQLTAGDLKTALETAELCLTEAAEEVKLHERISALLVAAIAHRRFKRPERAAELLEQALILGEPEGMFRPFIDGGSAVRSVLTVLVPPTSRSAGYAGRILQRLDSQLPVGSEHADGGNLPLSDSELAVLRFLPSHLTNEEIGEALFLSVNTVKTHLRSAYRKLGARSRREAIALARHRGLVA